MIEKALELIGKCCVPGWGEFKEFLQKQVAPWVRAGLVDTELQSAATTKDRWWGFARPRLLFGRDYLSDMLDSGSFGVEDVARTIVNEMTHLWQGSGPFRCIFYQQLDLWTSPWHRIIKPSAESPRDSRSNVWERRFDKALQRWKQKGGR